MTVGGLFLKGEIMDPQQAYYANLSQTLKAFGMVSDHLSSVHGSLMAATETDVTNRVIEEMNYATVRLNERLLDTLREFIEPVRDLFPPDVVRSWMLAASGR